MIIKSSMLSFRLSSAFALGPASAARARLGIGFEEEAGHLLVALALPEGPGLAFP